MTLDEALELAEGLSRTAFGSGPAAQGLARFVLDTLGAQMPCGWEGPRPVLEDDETTAHVEWSFGEETTLDPDEAIAIGAALVRAGLQAKGGE